MTVLKIPLYGRICICFLAVVNYVLWLIHETSSDIQITMFCSFMISGHGCLRFPIK